MKQKFQSLRHLAVKVLVLFITYHLSLITSSAQNFTQRIQQSVAGGGKVTIHHDASINELVNGKQQTAPAQKPAETKTNRQQDGQRQRGDSKAEQRASEQHTDTVAQEPHRTRQVMGYRIQVFVGGKTRADRQRAEQTANSLRTQFPGHKVYVHFYSPRWICRMGNFRTVAEAKEVLDEVVRMGYDTATLVRGKVTVAY